ncbi:ferredoxin oxidoreductase [Patescibacteria group bacterium]|nr:ferredoxin oxidoreductase [Patescibacteria group bacterium]
MKESKRDFITGAEVVIKACRDAGADIMYGYPITPTCEILSGWINEGYASLQTEDEIAAGFGVCGAVLAGQKAFTASSGPGHILLQDAFAMAEGMRLPFVMIVGQRGGPSSGTVIYSQQEVMLSCFGGNGEGMRFVYSPSSLNELYSLTRLAFNDAWKYRFPAVLLTDGYMLKTTGVIEWEKIKDVENSPTFTRLSDGANVHWPNIYTAEEELYEEVMVMNKDYKKAASKVAKAEEYLTKDAKILLVAHGIVAASAKEAIVELRKKGVKVGLFRPTTLRPFSKKQFDKAASNKSVKKILVAESSLGQLARIVHDEMDPEICKPFAYLQKPALGIEIEDIYNFVLKNNK